MRGIAPAAGEVAAQRERRSGVRSRRSDADGRPSGPVARSASGSRRPPRQLHAAPGDADVDQTASVRRTARAAAAASSALDGVAAERAAQERAVAAGHVARPRRAPRRGRPGRAAAAPGETRARRRRLVHARSTSTRGSIQPPRAWAARAAAGLRRAGGALCLLAAIRRSRAASLRARGAPTRAPARCSARPGSAAARASSWTQLRGGPVERLVAEAQDRVEHARPRAPRVVRAQRAGELLDGRDRATGSPSTGSPGDRRAAAAAPPKFSAARIALRDVGRRRRRPTRPRRGSATPSSASARGRWVAASRSRWREQRVAGGVVERPALEPVEHLALDVGVRVAERDRARPRAASPSSLSAPRTVFFDARGRARARGRPAARAPSRAAAPRPRTRRSARPAAPSSTRSRSVRARPARPGRRQVLPQPRVPARRGRRSCRSRGRRGRRRARARAASARPRRRSWMSAFQPAAAVAVVGGAQRLRARVGRQQSHSSWSTSAGSSATSCAASRQPAGTQRSSRSGTFGSERSLDRAARGRARAPGASGVDRAPRRRARHSAYSGSQGGRRSSSTARPRRRPRRGPAADRRISCIVAVPSSATCSDNACRSCQLGSARSRSSSGASARRSASDRPRSTATTRPDC